MVQSLHPTTIEVTTEEHLTKRGDCIIGVCASSGCAQLDERVKRAIRAEGSRLLIKVVAGGESFEVSAAGDPRLDLSHPRDIVVRKSEFLSDRTLAIRASSAAIDIPRSMVSRLRDPDTTGTLEIRVV